MVVLEAIELRNSRSSHVVSDWPVLTNETRPDLTLGDVGRHRSSRRISNGRSSHDYTPNYEVIDVNNLESGFKAYNCSDGSGGSSQSRSTEGSRLETLVPHGRTYGAPARISDQEQVKMRNKWTIDVDKLSEISHSISSIGRLFPLISTLIFFLDFASDLLLSFFLFRDPSASFSWITWTILLTIIPALLVNVLSLRWYLKDAKRRAKRKSSIIVFFHFLLLGPVLRKLNFVRKYIKCHGSLDRLHKMAINDRDNYGRKTTRAINSVSGIRRFQSDRISCQVSQVEVEFELIDRVVNLMDEERDTSLIALLKTLLESAPQLILQISVRVAGDFKCSKLTDAIQMAAIVTSLLQVAWSLSLHQRWLERSLSGDRHVITNNGSLVLFVSKLLDISSRSVAIAFFTSHFGYWLIPLAVGHWGIMTIWIMHQETTFCATEKGRLRPWLEYMLDMVIGGVYLISFLPVSRESKRKKNIFYFCLILCQNVTFSSLWYLSGGSNSGISTFKWLQVAALAYVYGALFLSLIFLLIFYHYFDCDRSSLGNQRVIYT